MPRVRRLLDSARGRALTLIVAMAAVAGVSGCDVQESSDLERGRTLFVENCGICHELAEAASPQGVGPNLDSSFAAARETGMDQDTIEGVVQTQIGNPRFVQEGVPEYAKIFMPADLVTGQDAEDVAAYVASVAGVPGIEPPPLGTPQEVFDANCASCHTLSAADATGTTGPNLDEVLPGKTPAQIEQSIRDPAAEVSPGFESIMMPVFDDSVLPEQNLKALIDYLLQSVGGGK